MQNYLYFLTGPKCPENVPRPFQKTEYRSAVLFLLMLLFTIAARCLACIFHFIAILERPNLQVKCSWFDHLADKYKMPYGMLILNKLLVKTVRFSVLCVIRNFNYNQHV